jgi:hypothetical protein
MQLDTLKSFFQSWQHEMVAKAEATAVSTMKSGTGCIVRTSWWDVLFFGRLLKFYC